MHAGGEAKCPSPNGPGALWPQPPKPCHRPAIGPRAPGDPNHEAHEVTKLSDDDGLEVTNAKMTCQYKEISAMAPDKCCKCNAKFEDDHFLFVSGDEVYHQESKSRA